MRLFRVGLVLLGILLSGGAAGAVEPGEKDIPAAPLGPGIPETYSFARFLMKKGCWEEAVVEFKRFCFLSPGHPLTAEAMLAIGRCYEEEGDFAKAMAAYRTVAQEFPNSGPGQEGHYLIGEAAYRAGEYDTARVELAGFLDKDPLLFWKQQAQYRMAWSSLRLHSFDAAAEEFSSIAAKEGPFRIPSEEIVQGIGQIGDLPYRSPWLAGVLSILLPGAGQFYAGAYQDGFLALLVNAALIVASYEAVDKEVYGAGGLVSLVALTFYSGNIYGAINSTHHANREELIAHLRPYRNKYEWISREE